MQPAPSAAKIMRPRLSGIFCRTRLFRLLDKNREKPVVWVGAPAGSGKTTLVASWLDARKLPCLWYQVDEGDGDIASFFYYLGLASGAAAPRYRTPLPLLTPEYLLSIPVFTRRYFEELFRRLRPPAIVVFDNFQDAPPDSGFHDMMAHALEVIPEGINVIILSRSGPPPQLSRLRANRGLRQLGPEEMRFTLNESRDLLKTGGRRQPSEKDLRVLHAKTDGWAAGLILLQESEAAKGLGEHDLDRLTAGGVFDYFACQIFDKTDEDTRRFLLATAFLPFVTTSLAERLTGRREAGEVLERLTRHHYFTQKLALAGQSYRYHALFREFLLARSRSYFGEEERLSLKRKAADLLQASGHTEDAAALLIDAGEWSALTQLVLQAAQALVTQGRSRTLEGWILAVPEETRSAGAWLSYWLGISRMAFDPRASRAFLEQGFERFRAARDAAGSFLSWAAIIETFQYEWCDFSPLDRWIATGEELLKAHPQMPSPEIEVRVAAGMLSAMTYRQPKHPDAPRWAGRVERIVLASGDVQLRMALGNQLIFYYLWVGDFSRISLVIDALRPSGGLKRYDPLTQQSLYVMEAMYSWTIADWATCTRSISEGLKNAEESGVHLLDLYLLAQGVYGGLTLGDPAMADACLEKMSLINSPRPGDRALYHYQASAVAWYHGDFKKSAEHGKEAVRMCDEVGWPMALTDCLSDLSVTLFDAGNFDEAEACLARAFETGSGMVLLKFPMCMSGAYFAFERGREKQGFDLLRRGLSLGARYGFLNFPRWSNSKMSRLLAAALEHGIETGYAHRLIKVRGLAPPEDAGPENWPYPVRIYGLGTFKIELDGKPLTFPGKAQKKPLELLKAIIAFGGSAVPEERISEALWPDADGYQAHKSAESNLLRLRRLLGSDQAIVLSEGRLSIDPRYCWTDVRAFEQAVKAAGAGMRGAGAREQKRKSADRDPHAAAPVSRLEKAVDLYRGNFLEGENGLAWTVSRREELRLACFKALKRLAAHYEQAGETEKAVEYYLKGITFDALAEEQYRDLMLCYQKLGREAEAIRVYHRCREALAAGLGVEPSSATRTIYDRLTDKRN